jgi:hypothetical protein
MTETVEPIVSPKEGDTVYITAPFPRKRRWWQFWKPRWVAGPMETRSYVCGRPIRAGENDWLRYWPYANSEAPIPFSCGQRDDE